MTLLNDGLCNPAITIEARQLAGLVCRKAAADCPLIAAERASDVRDLLARDPAAAVLLLIHTKGVCT